MAGAMARISINRRILTWDHREIEFSGDPGIHISDTVFGFLDEESEGSSVDSVGDNGYGENEMEDNDDEDKEQSENVHDKSFWESQNQQLQVRLVSLKIPSFLMRFTWLIFQILRMLTNYNAVIVLNNFFIKLLHERIFIT